MRGSVRRVTPYVTPIASYSCVLGTGTDPFWPSITWSQRRRRPGVLNGTYDLRTAAHRAYASAPTTAEAVRLVDGSAPFDEAEIRVAERALVTALEAPDPTAWVLEYTEDAIFDGGGEHVVQGREARLAQGCGWPVARGHRAHGLAEWA